MDRSSSRLVRASFAWCACAFAVLAACSCSRSSGDEEIASVDVPTITGEVGRAVRGDLVEPLVVRGSVVALPNQDVRVAALVAGRVDSLPVAEGDWVRSGQVVAEIDPRPFADLRRQAAATLAQARALTENARLNLDRTEQLFQRGIASGKEVEDARTGRQAAESGVEQAAAALDTADRQLSRTKVTSPISGQVVKRLVAVGEQVDGTAGEPLVEIANVDQVEVAANIPADHIGKVKVGQGAIVLSDAYAGREFPGQVIAIAPSVDSATNAALARVRLANPDRLLKVGMFAEVRVKLRDIRAALVVPPAAVSKTDEGAAVYVVSGDQATRTPVKTGLETPEAVEILSGLAEGQSILMSGVHGLGERVRLAHTR